MSSATVLCVYVCVCVCMCVRAFVYVSMKHKFLLLTAVHSLEDISKASQKTNSNEAERDRKGEEERVSVYRSWVTG